MERKQSFSEKAFFREWKNASAKRLRGVLFQIFGLPVEPPVKKEIKGKSGETAGDWGEKEHESAQGITVFNPFGKSLS